MKNINSLIIPGLALLVAVAAFILLVQAGG